MKKSLDNCSNLTQKLSWQYSELDVIYSQPTIRNVLKIWTLLHCDIWRFLIGQEVLLLVKSYKHTKGIRKYF